jgi:hypothetical protein
MPSGIFVNLNSVSVGVSFKYVWVLNSFLKLNLETNSASFQINYMKDFEKKRKLDDLYHPISRLIIKDWCPCPSGRASAQQA